MRNIFVIFLMCVFIGACGPKPDYKTDYKPSEKSTVGMWYFERNSDREDLEPYRAGLTDMFITELQKMPQRRELFASETGERLFTLYVLL